MAAQTAIPGPSYCTCRTDNPDSEEKRVRWLAVPPVYPSDDRGTEELIDGGPDESTFSPIFHVRINHISTCPSTRDLFPNVIVFPRYGNQGKPVHTVAGWMRLL